MFSQLSEMLEEGILVVMDRVVLQANQALMDLLGYESHEFVGRKIDDMSGGLELASFLDDVTKQAEKFSETIIFKKDGRPVRLRVRAETMPLNGTTAIMAVITERAMSDPAQWSSGRIRVECFRSIFAAAPDAIFVKDRDLRFVDVNPAMEKVLGLPTNQILGKKAEDVFGREAGERITGWDFQVLQGETIEKEHTVHVAGERLTFLDVRMPLRTGGQNYRDLRYISRYHGT